MSQSTYPQILEKIDLFGLKFNFNTFNRKAYHSIIGIILSLTIYVLLIFFIFYLGLDFFLQINPILSAQDLHPKEDDKFTKVDSKHFTISWRLENPSGSPFNYTNLLYPQFFYESFIRKNTTDTVNNRNNWKQNVDSIETEKCSKTFINDEDWLVQFPYPEKWNCINFQKYNITLGGLYLTTDFFNLVFRIYFCPGADFYDPKCSTYANLKNKLYTNNAYFSINYPRYYYDTKDKGSPLKVQYKNQRVLLDLFLNRQDRLFFEEYKLNNDKGIIFIENNTQVVLTQTKYENYFTSLLPETWEGYEKDKEFGENNLWDTLYLIRIYLDKDYTIGNLRYLKFQELAAVVGGLMEVFFEFGIFISSFFNNYYQNLGFINEYFEFSNSNYDKFKKVKTMANNTIPDSKRNSLSYGYNAKKTTLIEKDSNAVNALALEIDFSKSKEHLPINQMNKDSQLQQINTDTGLVTIFEHSDNYNSNANSEDKHGDNSNKKQTKSSFQKSRFSKMNYPYRTEGHISNKNNDYQTGSKDIDDFILIKKNLFSDDVNYIEDFYSLTKPKGDLVITDHALKKRNKIYKEDTTMNNEILDPIFNKYKEFVDVDASKRYFQMHLCKYFYLVSKHMCCKSKFTTEEQEDFKMYNYASKFVENTLDIVSYIKLQANVRRLKLLTLPGNNQSLAFNMFKKPNLKNSEEMKNLEMEKIVSDEEELKEERINSSIALMKFYAENFKSLNEVEKNAIVFDMLDPMYKLYIIDAAKELEKSKKEFCPVTEKVDNIEIV